LSIADNVFMPLDWKSAPLAEGLACYRNKQFFEAHEHWESAWLNLQEPEKSFLQALIQMTAAFHHLHTGNTVGACSLLRRTLRRLEACPTCYGGIFVTPTTHEIRAWLQSIESGSATPSAFPQISPLDSPD
jgi:uncharacterized protein